MQIIRYPDIPSFFEDHLDFLEQEEAANNLLIGIPRSHLSAANEGSSASINLYGILDNSGTPVLSLVQTPPYNYLIYAKETPEPALLEALLKTLRQANIKASGIIGPEQLAMDVAEHWQNLYGQSWKVGFRQLTYQLDTLQDVKLSSGTLRLAKEQDISILQTWISAFEEEAMGNENSKPDLERIRQKINQEHLFVWEDEKPKSMAAIARPTRHGITINYVYTPVSHRGKGYASSCVYALSKDMLQRYSFCNLFTDRDNPTSNKIYARMGYYPVKESIEIKFID